MVGRNRRPRVVEPDFGGPERLEVALPHPIVRGEDPDELARVPVGETQDAPRDHLDPTFIVVVQQGNHTRRRRRKIRGRTRRVAGVKLPGKPRHPIMVAVVLPELDDVVRVDRQAVLDLLPAAVRLRNLLVLVGDDEEAIESESRERGVERGRHVLAFVDHQERMRPGSLLRQLLDDLLDAMPVDLPETLAFRRQSGNGPAGLLFEPLQEPPDPGSALETVAEQLAARPIEEMVEDEEPIVVPLPLVAAGADECEHGLPRPRPADDEMLAFLRQGARRLLILAEVLDPRQLELALRHQPVVST